MIFAIKPNPFVSNGPKIVSGSQYTRRPWTPGPAHEATTRVPFGAGSRNIPPAAWPPQRLCGWLRLNAADLWINGSVHHFIVTARTPAGPSGARLGHGLLSRTDPNATRDQTKGKMRWSRLSSLLRRQLDRIVDPRLTEILVEVAGIPVGAGEACPFRVRIRAGASAAAAFASGRLVLDAASLRLPAAV